MKIIPFARSSGLSAYPFAQTYARPVIRPRRPVYRPFGALPMARYRATDRPTVVQPYYTGRPRVGAYTGSPLIMFNGLGAASDDKIAARVAKRSIPGVGDPSRAVTGEQARLQFLAWMRKHHPKLLDAAVRDVQMQGLGDTAATSPSLLDSISKLGTQYLAFREQQQLLEANIARARAGATPIAAYTPAGAAATGAQFVPAPTYSASLMDTINAMPTMTKAAIVGALGFLGYKLVAGRRGRR